MCRFLLLMILAGQAASRLGAAGLDELVPHASGLWLVEVLDLVEYDERPGDGDKGIRVKLRGVRGSGHFSGAIYIITAFGGHRAPGDHPKLPTLIKPGSLKKGEQYWIAFASVHDYTKHPQGVIRFWHKGDKAVEKWMEEAVSKDRYGWSPQFDPKTKITYGRQTDDKAGEANKRGKQWRIRVERKGKLLWEKSVPGVMSTRSFSWVLDPSAEANFPGKVPVCGKVLVAETATRLAANNEYKLPPGMVYLQTVYDPETGARLIDRVSRHQGSMVWLLRREYHPKTGKIEKEVRD